MKEPSSDRVREIERRLRAEALEIFQLCWIARRVDLAAELFGQGMTPRQVRAELLRLAGLAPQITEADHAAGRC